MKVFPERGEPEESQSMRYGRLIWFARTVKTGAGTFGRRQRPLWIRNPANLSVVTCNGIAKSAECLHKAGRAETVRLKYGENHGFMVKIGK
jgi:hypothetical protein